ncbi:hypothetical protein A3860_32945 [Niastella vici]|uniref:Uncharacterized protein n=1 Tax=Niastella vici TaxID=1703345 RepID=A0A1V9FQK8_9BACT|nr:hypothetical protein A3860_32945 [Niastella vici]
MLHFLFIRSNNVRNHYNYHPALIIPPSKLTPGSICAASQKRLFHIQIRLFAGEVEPYVEINWDMMWQALPYLRSGIPNKKRSILKDFRFEVFL